MKKQKIAIIGAGLAGLTAAYRLFLQNYDIQVFEARNRVGGRLLSVWMKNPDGNTSVIEMGGQNLTDGGEATNIQTLIDEFGLEVDSRYIRLSSLIHHQEKYIHYNQLITEFLKAEKDSVDNLYSIAEKYTSMGELLHSIFANYPPLKTALYTYLTAYEGIDANRQSVYHNVDTLSCILQGGFALAHEAYEHEQDQIFFKQIKNGAAQLPLKMSAVLKDRVHLNKILKRVIKSKEEISISFDDGTTETFDSLILAIPASVYHDIEFDPQIIPKNILEKINKIDYGQNTKIHFPINHLNENGIRSIVSDKFVSFINPDNHCLTLYLNHPQPSVAEEIALSQTGFGTDISILNTQYQFIADQHYATYDHAAAYSWSQDPFSQGSYSGYSTNISMELDEKVILKGIEFKKLFQPINHQVFFIGEHTTILDFIGTMEAAVESAERVVQYLLSS